MTRQTLEMSSSYLAVVRGIRELHRLTLLGMDESPEADAIRDATDGPWEALSEEERKRAAGLSKDLFSISEPTSEEVPEENSQAQAGLNEVEAARAQGEWDRALELLRRWGKYLPPALVRNLRASIWSEAGDLETAFLFYEQVSRPPPENGKGRASFPQIQRVVDSKEGRH